MPGAFDPNTDTAYIGNTTGHGSSSLALHELGHVGQRGGHPARGLEEAPPSEALLARQLGPERLHARLELALGAEVAVVLVRLAFHLHGPVA